MKRLVLLLAIAPACYLAAGLSGNWVVRNPLPDGTERRTYLDLKQEGPPITGHIRATQFYYEITESTGGPAGFTITGSMHDGNTIRNTRYEGKLEGDSLHIATRRRPDAPLVEMVAERAPDGEGAIYTRSFDRQERSRSTPGALEPVHLPLRSVGSCVREK